MMEQGRLATTPDTTNPVIPHTAHSLYRTWRSRDFAEVVGQGHVTQTLRNAVRTNSVGHAYLFTGLRGTGKTSTARILARAVNCLNPREGEPCNECAPCRSILEGRCLDVLEIDAASHNGVEYARDLIEKVHYAPSEVRRKVYIIDECFSYDALITLADGSKRSIGSIVDSGWKGEVLSYNEHTGQLEPKPIVRHMKKRPTQPMVRLVFNNNRALVCTANHKFYTPDGKVEAGQLIVGQFVHANYERVTKQQLQVASGTALGDGCLSLTPSGMRARLSLRHGAAQKDYLDYKVRLLGDLVATPVRFERAVNSYSKHGQYCATTLSRPHLALLHRELYDEQGRKRISPQYLARLSPLGLALWYLDDGSFLINKNRHVRKDGSVAHYPVGHAFLCMNNFSLSEAAFVSEWFESQWGASGGVSNTAKGPVLWFTAAGTDHLHRLVARYVPPVMQYKLRKEHQGQIDLLEDDRQTEGLAVTTVKSIEYIPSCDFVYNIEVADNHNYFARDILVANCHMLSKEASNALLKTLEEPPPHILFVLATTDAYKVLTTITSRCQRLDFRAIDLDDITTRLAYICAEEGIQADAAALDLIAEQATGSLRDALSLLEQVRAYESTAIGVEEVEQALGMARRETLSGLTESIVEGDVGAAMTLISELAAAGADLRQYAKQLIGYWRDLLLLCAIGPSAARARSHDPRAMALAARLSTSDVTAILKTILQPDYSGRRSASAQWQLELAVVEACQYFGGGRESAGSRPQTETRQTPPGSMQTNAAEPTLPRPSKMPAPTTAASPIATSTPPPAPITTTAEPSYLPRTLDPANSMPRVSATAVTPPSVIAEPTAASIMGAAAPIAVKGRDSTHAASETPTPSLPTTPPGGSAIEEVVDAAQHETETVRAPQEQPQLQQEQPQLQQVQPQQVAEAPVVAAEHAPASHTLPHQDLATLDAQRVWRQLLHELWSSSRKLKTALEASCKPQRFEGSTLVLSWVEGLLLLTRQQVDNSTAQTQIETALAKIVGQPVRVRYDTVDRPEMTTGNGLGANANGHGGNGTGGNANGKAPPAVRRDATPRDTFVDDAERTLRGLHMAPKRP